MLRRSDRFSRRTLLASTGAALGCAFDGPGQKGPRVVTYWEKWTNFEGDAAEEMVQTFNRKERARAQHEPGYRPIEVQRVAISRLEEKLLVAVAGGNPPDVAGFYSHQLAAYAAKGALVDLTDILARANISESDYVPIYWQQCGFKGRTWAVPTTPSSQALHMNQRLFAQGGLDPDRPPKTIEELDMMAEKLTRWEVTSKGKTRIQTGYASDVPTHQKRLLQAGFLPSEPSWWHPFWGYYFGGELVNGKHVTTTASQNVRAYEWVQSYSRKVGVDSLQRFRSGFGQFASPQNPFISGKLAMQMQGPWMYNFIDKYAPAMPWSAAPFPIPEALPELRDRSFVECDILVIPKGCRRPVEAIEFLKFATSREGLEQLCLGQRKFSPLRTESEDFIKRHPHPRISLFRRLAESKTAFGPPSMGVWTEYRREMLAAFDSMIHLRVPARTALAMVESKIQAAFERDLRVLERRGGLG